MKNNFRYNCLFNALLLLSSTSDERNELRRRYMNLDFYDELENMLDLSMRDNFRQELIDENIVSLEIATELQKLYNFVMNIDTFPWDDNSFDYHQDWKTARSWAQTIFIKLGFSRYDADFSDEKVINIID